MTPDAIQTLDIEVTKTFATQWGWILAFGVALVVLGAAAIVRSVTTTLVSMMFFGWLLILAAAVEGGAAFWVGHWAGFFQHALAATLYGVIGLIFVLRPKVTAEVLTAVMAILFLVGGIFQIVGSGMIGYGGAGYAGWGWHIIDGAINVALGLMILVSFPSSALWVIGLFIGVDLIFYGATWIAIAFGLKAGA
jgi:uncharacterized membrane protein HdeD (DUF308 family)